MKRFTLMILLAVFARMVMADVAVSITVISARDYSTPVSGATVSLNGTDAMTDANGVALFTVTTPTDDEYLPYSVTSPGFIVYNDNLYIPGGASDQQATVYINPAYSISFTVQDKDGNPVAGAQVQINDKTAMTTASGVALFDKAFAGGWNEYTYTITAAGYADYSNTVDVISDDVVVPPITLDLAYDITFTVKDGSSSPVADAMVVIGNESLMTGADGSVVFHKKINGSYSCLVSRSGYIDLQGDIAVTDGNASAQLVLQAGYDVAFAVMNGASGNTPLPNDTITVGNISKLTDANGIAVFGVAPGTISFTCQKTGFADVPVNLEVTDHNLADTIQMKPIYTVVFSVVDEMSYMPIEGAAVSFNGLVINTDMNGMATFSNVEPAETDYTYSITADGGYNNASGSVSLPLSSPYADQANQFSQGVTMVKPGISISLAEGMMSYFGGASVSVNGQDYYYDTGMGMARVDIAPGTYTCIITPDDETKAILKETIEVGTSGHDYASFDVVDGFNVEIYTVDRENNPVEGSLVVLDGDTVFTDATGDALFARKAPGDYSYSITKEGYRNIADANISVNTADVLEVATLNLPGYLLTVTVTDGSHPLADVTVSINGTQVNTDADGKAVFEGLAAGTYDYAISKTGFTDASGQVTITDQDVLKTVQLTTTGVKLLLVPGEKPYPNPTNGLVYVSLPGTSGQAELEIITASGCILKSCKVSTTGNPVAIDLSPFPAGLYLISVRSSEVHTTWQVVKQ